MVSFEFEHLSYGNFRRVKVTHSFPCLLLLSVFVSTASTMAHFAAFLSVFSVFGEEASSDTVSSVLL